MAVPGRIQLTALWYQSPFLPLWSLFAEEGCSDGGQGKWEYQKTPHPSRVFEDRSKIPEALSNAWLCPRTELYR